MDRWAWRVSLLLGAALLPLVALLPQSDPMQLLWIAISAVTFAAACWSRRLHRSGHPDTYGLVRLGMGGFALSSVLIFAPLGFAPPHPMAGANLVAYAGAYVLVSVAMLRMADLKMGGHDLEGRVDTAVVAVAAAAVLFDTVAMPLIATTDDPVTAVVYGTLPVLQAAMAAATIRLMVSGAHRSPSAWFFAVAAFASLVANVTFLPSLVDGTQPAPLRVLWLVCYVCIAAGLLHPSAAELGAPAPGGYSAGRLAVIGLALVSLPTVMLFEHRVASRVPALAAILCVALVLWRASKLLLERERVAAELAGQARGQASLSDVGHAAIVAGDAEEYVARLRQALADGLGGRVTLELPGDDAPLATDERRLALGAELGTLRVRFDDVATARAADPYLGTARDLTEAALRRWRVEDLLRHQSLHDTLTGLPNRALVCRTIEQRLARSSEPRLAGGPDLAVLFVDLDGFKAVNDTLGHAVGDRVLAEVATRLLAEADEHDLVGRLAGDEFVVVCAAADAVALAHRVLVTVGRPLTTDLGDARVGASIGVAVAAPGDTAERLIQRADAAMYTAKHGGKGRIEVCPADVTGITDLSAAGGPDATPQGVASP
ncbi:GGDEF domain-containing protein [Egicoccus halophilus]|uniref:GGDEF domain-containing protein n=1 Tax=Egicoccus halophilus TaxID=1670830 RepID=A0A8J3EU17_9ACTN|nr:GGDEF domain-containing protein [Egicoccus halophilus]GGI06220.1 hypothetical protein GCM10011354_18000 [Egicoccus halophilus]